MTYRVKRKYGQGIENHLQDFRDEKAAREYIKEQIEKEPLIKNVTYLLYDFDELVTSFDASNAPPSSSGNESNDAQGQGKSSSFQPSPLSTTLRPSGMPNNWKKDDDEEKK